MEKVNVGTTPVRPSPAVIVGALVNGKANYLTLGSFGGVSVNPQLVYISLFSLLNHQQPYTNHFCYNQQILH